MEMMMKLYYRPGACSLASHILLIANDIPYTLDKVDLKEKLTEDGGDFRRVNPKGYIPALELDDGEVLTENVAVLSYIATRGGIGLPKDGLAHWRVLETTTFITSELHKNFVPFFDPTADDAARERGRKLLTARFALADRQLGDRAFIVGDEFSIADAYLFVMISWAGRVGLAVPPNLEGYYRRLAKLPAVAAALEQEGLPVPA
jgi:glutathione S-transferase